MKELEKILKDLQKRGYQQVDIGQVLSWMYDIQRENRLKRAERRQMNANGRVYEQKPNTKLD